MDATDARPLAGARVSYLMVDVDDVAGTVAFYRDLLGLEVAYSDDECGFLRLPGEGPQLAFFPRTAGAAVAERDWMLVLDVHDVEDVAAALAARGVAVGPVRDVPYGRAATFRDPAGNVVEIHQPSRGG